VPSDIVPCSATLNYVRWDAEKRAEINFKDGQKKEVSVEDLSKYVTKITKESEKMADSVQDAVVYYPCPFCQNGVQIVDTPGLNDDERMTDISERVIPNLDAIIMVIVPDSPFSQSEAEFVRNKVMASDLGRIIFVVNKIDTVDEDERDSLMRTIRTRIEDSILGKMAAMYGEDSEEYLNTKDKMGDIKLLAISAKKALKGKLNNNPEMVKESGYPEFENMISKLLTEQRGLLELIHPINQLTAVAKEMMQTIDTRINALKMDAEEFEQVQLESIEIIKETRDRKQEEINKLKAKSNTISEELLPEIKKIYDEVEDEILRYVNDYPVSEEDVKDNVAIQNFSENVSKEIDKKMTDILAIKTEKLTYQINEQLGEDIKELEKFGKEFSQNIEGIHFNVSECVEKKSSVKGSDIIIDAAVTYGSALCGGLLPGVGGIISGYREHGLKGAVVGGTAGVFAGAAACAAAVSIGMIGWPIALIAGVASTFGGKAIVSWLFGKNKNTNESFRENLRKSVIEMTGKMKEEAALEKWLTETCATSYNSVADDIDKEWEASLKTMEETLTQIKIDLEMNAANRDKVEHDMRTYAEETKVVVENIQPVYMKLAGALNQR